ncbi:hypothetical protein OWR29_17475 [Actinoplanes sp. Pm04-4]|uniref:Uncharacterized protein n=1 Tax=Paractinoplanes pyxinae TaxID=2997416 RepID=A0ABT4AZX6_9ACTN|nr:hypothetical protein [Actinoplanes pyxinae]MCY1139794.1 hypothetical protein [Actinoplanes pyxinae]
MENEIELISDGDGLAVIGHPAAVERFLAAESLPSKDLGLKRLTSALGTGSKIAKAGAEMSEKSGRWVQLTAESAQKMKKYELMKGSESGLSRAVLTDHGKITGLLEIVRTPGAMLTNPAMLTGAAGLMAQLAMKQSMEEITEYLAVIDAKVDAVLRAQTDAVVADMIGVELVIDEALTIRERVGHVSEVTWSKVQATPIPLASVQAYALRQIDAVTETLDTRAGIGDLAQASKKAETKIGEWLAVLARCFQLQDAVAVLELDRVLDTTPDDLENHRVAIRTGRENRLAIIATTTDRLLARLDAAATTANTGAKLILNPTASPALVHSTNHIRSAVIHFHTCLGHDRESQTRDARRWLDAATAARNRVLTTGTTATTAALTATTTAGTTALTATTEASSKALTATTEAGSKALDAATTAGAAALNATSEAGSKVVNAGAEGVNAAGRLGLKAFGRAKKLLGGD